MTGEVISFDPEAYAAWKAKVSLMPPEVQAAELRYHLARWEEDFRLVWDHKFAHDDPKPTEAHYEIARAAFERDVGRVCKDVFGLVPAPYPAEPDEGPSPHFVAHGG